MPSSSDVKGIAMTKLSFVALSINILCQESGT